MCDEAVNCSHSTARLLEAAKTWLTCTPWESDQGAVGESTAATVLCELMELSRLRHLLYTATTRYAGQQLLPCGTEKPSVSPRADNNGDALHCGKQQHVDFSCPTPTGKAQMTCTAVRQRFKRLLKRSNAHVQEFYRATRSMDSTLSSKISETTSVAPAAQTSVTCMTDIDASDVFWALVLYMSAALCWRQHRLLGAQRSTDVCAEGVVSSSRETSEGHPRQPHITSQLSRPESPHSSLSSPADYLTDHMPRDTATPYGAGGGPGADFFTALRSHYTLEMAAADKASFSRCRSVLARLLPLLESRLSVAQLWRQPSLLAALDVLARGFAKAEDRVHASPSRSDTHTASRCPLCYAAALDNELAVEALVHLRYYAVAYHGEEGVAKEAGALQGQTRSGSDRAKLSVCEVGWIAACRIALWNHCQGSLKRLCCSPLFCTTTWWPHHQEACDTAGWRRYAVLEALWVSWWQAEVWLGSCPSFSVILSKGTSIGRDAAARWRSALLFIQILLPAAEAAAREPCVKGPCVEGGATGKDPRSQCTYRRALLAHLVQLPLVTKLMQQVLPSNQDEKRESIPTAGACNCCVSGTVFHWLSQQGDVPLLTLLCRTLDSRTAAMRTGKAPVGQPVAALAVAAGHANRAYVIQLGATHGLGDSGGNHRGHRRALPAPEAAAVGAVESTGDSGSQPAPTGPGRSLCSSTASVWGLHLMDTLGQNALDVACRHQHLPCVRLLLQAGLSPNSLSALVSDRCVDSLPLPLLKLLYDPSLLEGADSSRSMSHMGLAERLRQPTCPAAVASRTLAQLALRLWREKVQRLSIVSQASNDEGFTLDQWLSSYTRCQAAQDRVLRPAMAALEFDAYEPMARLVLLSVLTQKLSDWLTTAPPSVRFGSSGLAVGTSGSLRNDAALSWTSPSSPLPQPALPSLRQVRLQHTVALRLYTQLTCPLGRALLRRAVDTRCAVCDALAAREDKAASVLLACAAATSAADAAKKDAVVLPTATSVSPASVTAPLAPSEAVKQRQELQRLYERVLADAQALDARLAAEHPQCISAMEARGQWVGQHRRDGVPPQHLHASLASTHGVATLLRGRHRERHTYARRHPHRRDSSHDDEEPALYALVVIPSAEALQSARWESSANPRNVEELHPQHTTADVHRIIEPTVWILTSTPQQVWIRLPDGVDFDRLLRENNGGGFGVVADDMPPTAPVQRGDLVTFRCCSGSDSASGSADISARVQHKRKSVKAEERHNSPQFVVQQVFSERRTQPYLVWKNAATENKDLHQQPPPATLVLPYAVAEGAPAWTVTRRAAPRRTSGTTDQLQDSITLRACCLPVSHVVRITSVHLHNRHPLDWFQQARCTAASSPNASESGLADVLTMLQSNAEWTARWAQTVWAGHQPCWLEEKMPAADDNNGASQDNAYSSHTCGRHPSSCRRGCGTGDSGHDVVHLTDPFSTWDDAGATDIRNSFCFHGERRSLQVLLASPGDGAALHEAQRPSAGIDWPSRAEGGSAEVTADVVLCSAIAM